MAKKVFLVGAGPGSKEYVTLAAKKAVRKATLVIGAQRALELFKEDIKGETCILRAQNLDEVLQRTLASAQEERPVALLSTGDPTFFGLLRPLLQRSPVDLEIELVPGISSIQVCAARLKICLDEVEYADFHGQPVRQKEAQAGRGYQKKEDSHNLARSKIVSTEQNSGVPNEGGH